MRWIIVPKGVRLTRRQAMWVDAFLATMPNDVAWGIVMSEQSAYFSACFDRAPGKWAGG